MERSLSPELGSALKQSAMGVVQVSKKRKVSDSLFSTPVPSIENSSTSNSSSASASISFKSKSPLSDRLVDLPSLADSEEGLEWIGFEEDAAAEIWNNYSTRPDPQQNPYDLFKHVTGHLSRINLKPLSQSPPSVSMTTLGIKQNMQDAILDPDFSDVFRTQDLRYWLKDTLYVNYLVLKMALERSNRLEQTTLGKNKETPKRPNLQDSEFEFTKNLTILKEGLPKFPNHTILYKGKSTPELMLRRQGMIRADGSLNLDKLYSEPGGDFNARDPVHYWSPQKETAYKYRQYAANRSPYAETLVIEIQIPNEFLEPLHREILWFSPDWKEFVWLSKKKISIKKQPAKFDGFNKDADLIIGPICSSIPSAITMLEADEVQTAITEEDVMRISTGKASQWVFMKEDIIDRLAEILRGKMHIELYFPIARDPSKNK
jgi:hypothetical protein